MEHSPKEEPMKRRARFSFDDFDSAITLALREAGCRLETQPDTIVEVEHSVGHMMLEGVMDAEGALLALEAYEKNLQQTPELPGEVA